MTEVAGRQSREVLRIGARGRAREEASLPEEAAVRLVLNGEPLAELSATPLDLPDLAVGHLVLAGRVRARADVDAVKAAPLRGGWVVRVTGTGHAPQPPRPRLPLGPRLAAPEVRALMKGLFESAALYREGGGVHTSALANPQGEALVAADVGKVNTLDRLAGQALLRGVDPTGMVLLTTGRLTAAMVARGLALGAPVLVSHSGPTTEGLALAEARKATLIGYARGGAFKAYCGARRLRLGSDRRR